MTGNGVRLNCLTILPFHPAAECAWHVAGLDNIAALLAARRYYMRVDMVNWWGNLTADVLYDNFSMSGSSDNYRLTSVGSSCGIAGLLCLSCITPAVCRAVCFKTFVPRVECKFVSRY